MQCKTFTYFRPRSLPEIMEWLDSAQAGSFVLLGGGTDAMVKMRQRLLSPDRVISLRDLTELKKLEHQGDDIFIGAGLTLHVLEESSLIKQFFPALAQAARSAASPQLRNMGTIGGNICLDTRCLYFNQVQWPGSFAPCFKRGGDRCHVVKGGKGCYALFSADTPAALLAYDARILLVRPEGNREVALDEFYRDNGLSCTIKEERELVMGVKLAAKPRRVGRYEWFSLRGAIDFPLAGVAVSGERGAGDGQCSFRVAATGIRSRPIRLRKMEELLGRGVRPGTIGEKELSEATKDITIVRHQGLSPSYRRQLLKAMIAKALEGLRESE